MSNRRPLDVVLLWHMHQPYYVDPLEKVALMPWVRLHAVKGYLDMIDLARRVPEVRMNFNFTPVLLRQLLEFSSGSVHDLWAGWSRKPASDLSPDERRLILENFFKINHPTQVYPHARYRQLLEMRGKEGTPRQIKSAVNLFNEQDLRDLQTWYNLAWCGFSAHHRFPELTELRIKGSGFTEAEKNRVLDIHAEIVDLIPSLYREASESGQIELTTTPYFHPIMPLVYDTDFAHRCMPGRELPARFQAPDDVRDHLLGAQRQHQKVFGAPARGLWPSEGSVAPELLPLFREAGIDYFCTDEDVLFRSLENDPVRQHQRPDHLELFQPWMCTYQDARVGALFRERPLSDFIGFNAARNSAADAVGYLIHHLEHLSTVASTPHPTVTLALDGENAWEAFQDGGEEFLRTLYEKVAASPCLVTRRMAEVFDQADTARLPVVSHLHTGSWIGAQFDIWIGDAEENTGWERIAETRAFLVEALKKHNPPLEVTVQAWDALHAAEGSDWFWWYGPDFQTDSDMLFDLLFRRHLQRVYLLLGEDPPSHLDIPIQQAHTETPALPPRDFILPEVGGFLEGFYEWMGAGYFDVSQQQTAMFQSDRRVRSLYYGFNPQRIFMRVDLAHPWRGVIEFRFSKPSALVVRAESMEGNVSLSYQIGGTGRFMPVSAPHGDIAWNQCLEWALDFEVMNWIPPLQTIALEVAVMENSLELERYPERGMLEFPGPSKEFQTRNWFV
ncbi:MAG: glycoside hydrolase family 57 protein [Candidatus Methylacidiphilales bacterium]